MTLRRLLSAAAAVVLSVFGWLAVAGAVRMGSGLYGVLGALIAVAALLCSGIAAHESRLLALEVVLGTLTMAAAGMLLLANLMGIGAGYAAGSHAASAALVLSGAAVFWLYRRKRS